MVFIKDKKKRLFSKYSKKTYKIMAAVFAAALLLLALSFLFAQHIIKTNRDIIRLSQVQDLRMELASYYFKHNHYPLNIYEAKNIQDKILCEQSLCLEYLPSDPKTNSPYDYKPCLGSEINNCQLSAQSPNYYLLSFSLEKRINGIEAGPHIATPARLCADNNCAN